MQDQLAGEVPMVGAVIGEPLDQLQQPERVSRRHRARGGEKQLAVDEAEQRRDVLVPHLLPAEREDLVEQRQRVARAAFGGAGDAGQGFVGDLDLLPLRHRPQVGLDVAGGDHPEVVLLAAGEDRVGQLVVLGGGEDELHPGRRLLQRLQERVEGARRKHVDLVDDPDAEAVTGRVVARALPQLADLVDAVVGGAVDLLDVEAGPGGDLPARVALPARIRRRPLHAVEGLGQDARRRRLADTARAREKERVADAARRQRVAQRAGDGGLAHDLVEGLGPPLTREDEVGHGRAGADRT